VSGNLGNAATQTELLDAYVQRFAPSALVGTGCRTIAQVMDSELRTSIRSVARSIPL
jgi:hypothetical protein